MSWLAMTGTRLRKLRRPAYLVLFLFFSVIGYFAVGQIVNWLPFTEEERVKYRDLSYDSSRDPNPWQVMVENEELGEFVRGDLEISFRMIVDFIDDYDNVFQTAPWNQGIRLELAKPAKLAFVISERAGTGVNPRGLYLTQRLEPGKWYTVRLRIDPANRFQAWVNDFSVIDIEDATWAYAVSEVAVGTGFNRTRPFHGKVEDFSLRFGIWKPKAYSLFPLLFFRSFFTLLAAVLAILLCFDFVKWAGRVVSLWAQHQMEDLFLFHFLICSGGLLRLVSQLADISVRRMAITPTPFNDWTLNLVFPSKPVDLAIYLSAIMILPAYYAIAYRVLRRPEGKAYRFFSRIPRKSWTPVFYLTVVFCGNLLVLFFARLFGRGWILLLEIPLWTFLFFLPWYLGPGQISPFWENENRRSSEEQAL